MNKKYWVLFKCSTDSPSIEQEKVVEINHLAGALPDLLRAAVMPDRPGDPVDGMKSQHTRNCILLNWIVL